MEIIAQFFIKSARYLFYVDNMIFRSAPYFWTDFSVFNANRNNPVVTPIDGNEGVRRIFLRRDLGQASG
jgi:hypothetical protein